VTQRLIFTLCCLVFAIAGCPAEKPGGGSPSASAASSPAPAASSATPAAPRPSAVTPPIKPLPAGSPLRIGVTLHPYYSWTKNVVGDAEGVEVRSILPGDVDAGNYQPSPEDIKKLADLEALVINGIGHDDFIDGMLEASGNEKVLLVRPNDATPTIRSAHGGSVNSHTFISFTNAVQQTYAIAKALSALRPDLAATFEANAGEYAKRLRKMKADAAAKLASPKITRVVTVHDGYSYFCQEFGVEVAGVVEPAHGLVPSAQELGAMLDLIKKEKIEVVLSEESFPEKLLATLKESANVKVYLISHIASGDYTADKFEKEMQKNAETLVEALTGG
jgi:zinc transport system substrate-binding protein